MHQINSLGGSIQSSPKSNLRRGPRDQTSNLLFLLQSGMPSNKSVSNSVASFTQMKAIFSNQGSSNEKRYKKNHSTKFLPNVFPSMTNRNSGTRDLSISRDNEDGPKISTKRIVLNQSANVNLNFKQKSSGAEQYSILSASTNYNSAKLPQAERSKDMSNENPFRILKYSRRLAKLSENCGMNNDPSVPKAQLCHKILVLLSAEDGKYQEETRVLVEEIEKSLYCQSGPLIERIHRLSSTIINQNEVTSVPYFEITKSLVSCFEAERQMYVEQIAERDDQIDKLQQEKLELDDLVEKLQKEKDEITAERDKNLENNMAELNNTVSKIQQERDTIYREFMNMKANIDDAQTNFDQTVADEYVQHIKNLATEKLSIEDDLSKKTLDLDNLKASYLELINSYRKSIVKLKFSREQMNKMEEQIKQLGIDNAKLAVRAATGFDQLTPRPNLNPILEYFDVKPGNYVGTKEKVQLITKTIHKKENKAGASSKK